MCVLSFKIVCLLRDDTRHTSISHVSSCTCVCVCVQIHMTLFARKSLFYYTHTLAYILFFFAVGFQVLECFHKKIQNVDLQNANEFNSENIEMCKKYASLSTLPKIDSYNRRFSKCDWWHMYFIQ